MSMRTLDISEGGLKLEANFDLGIGEVMDLAILINGKRIGCRGKILGIEELDRKVQARVRFTRTSGLDQRKLSDYLHTRSMKPLEKRLIGGLFVLALVAVIVTAIIGYFQYFRSGLDRGPLTENQQLKGDISARGASSFKTGAGVESLKEGTRPEKEKGWSLGYSRTESNQEGDTREPPKDLDASRLSRVNGESAVESMTTQDTSEGPRLSRLEERESREVSKKIQAEVSPHSSGQRIQAEAVIAGTPPGVSRPEIRRSAIALGVKDREPVGISQRVSVRQGRVYCWMYLVRGQGGTVTVRWTGKGQRIAEVHLPVGSNSWRTWAYLSLESGMIGPAQVDILDEHGEILETLSFEITE
jgi:hypothetical protein